MFPTLGVGMEEALTADPEALRAVPGLQPLGRRRLGLRLPGPYLRGALITLLDPDQAAATSCERARRARRRVMVCCAGPS